MDLDTGEGIEDYGRANIYLPDDRIMNRHLLRYGGKLYDFLLEKYSQPLSCPPLSHNDYDNEEELFSIVDHVKELGILTQFEPHCVVHMTELHLLWQG